MRFQWILLSHVLCLILLAQFVGCQTRPEVEFRLNLSATEPAQAIAITSDETLAVIVGGRFHSLLQEPEQGYAFVIDLKRRSVERQLPPQTDGESGVVILGNGPSELAVTSSFDGSVQLSKLQGTLTSQRIPLGAGAITAICAMPSGKGFFAAGYGGNQSPDGTSVVVCDPNGVIAQRYRAGSNMIVAIAPSPDGQTVAWCESESGDVVLLDLASGKRRVLRPGVLRSRHLEEENRRIVYTDSANTLAFTEAGRLLIGGERGENILDRIGWIELWDIQMSRIERSASSERPVSQITAVGKVAATVQGGILHLWSTDAIESLPCKPLQNISLVAVFAHGRNVLYLTSKGVIGELATDKI